MCATPNTFSPSLACGPSTICSCWTVFPFRGAIWKTSKLTSVLLVSTILLSWKCVHKRGMLLCRHSAQNRTCNIILTNDHNSTFNCIQMLTLCTDGPKNDWFVSGSISTTPYLLCGKRKRKCIAKCLAIWEEFTSGAGNYRVFTDTPEFMLLYSQSEQLNVKHIINSRFFWSGVFGWHRKLSN